MKQLAKTAVLADLKAALSQVLLGKEEAVRLTLVCLIARGHLLIEDVPGVGKTSLAESLARLVDGGFRRLQCTSDLLPGDILGVSIYRPQFQDFEFRPGPVFANFLLADEINRATPKTQSALLEAMQERQTSIAGTIHPLPDPFMVLATQNPIEEEGTYVLPHAQMDRFLLKEIVDYPTEDDELMVLERIDDGTLGQHMTGVDAVATTAEVAELQGLVRRVYVDPAIRRYVVSLVRATRHVGQLLGPDLGNYVEIGASPRGSIAFFQAARAMAVVQGRHYVIPEDVRELRHSVLRHRIHLSFEALADRIRPEMVIDAVFRAVPTP